MFLESLKTTPRRSDRHYSVPCSCIIVSVFRGVRARVRATGENIKNITPFPDKTETTLEPVERTVAGL